MAILNPITLRLGDYVPTRIHPASSKTESIRVVVLIQRSWEVLCALWALVTLAHLLFLRNGSVWARSELLERFAPLRDWRRSIVLAIASALLLSGIIILFLVTPTPGWQFILIVAGTLLVLWPAWDLVRRGARVTAIGYLTLSVVVILFLNSVFYFLRGEGAFWSLFKFRSISITSGISPLLPLILLIAAGYWWAWHNLTGLAFLDHRRPHLPDCQQKDDTGLTTGLNTKLPATMVGISQKEAQRLIRVARPFGFDTRVVIPMTFLWLVLVFCFVGPKRPIQSLEGRLYDWVYVGLFGVSVLGLLGDLLRLMMVWIECRRLLQSLDGLTPMHRALIRLRGFSLRPVWRLLEKDQLANSGLKDMPNFLSRQLESASHLRNALDDGMVVNQSGQTRQIKDALDNLIVKQREASKGFLAALNSEATGGFWSKANPTQQIVEHIRNLQRSITEACGVVFNFLIAVWAKETKFVSDARARGKSEEARDEANATQSPIVSLAEEFVALAYMTFIMHFVLRIRTLVFCVGGMFVFILASARCYPFEPRLWIFVIMVGIFLLMGAVVAIVYAEMYKNAILRQVTDATPGKSNSEFWAKIAAFGAIPLLSLLAAQFPEISRFLFSWLQPAMEAVK